MDESCEVLTVHLAANIKGKKGERYAVCDGSVLRGTPPGTVVRFCEDCRQLAIKNHKLLADLPALVHSGSTAGAPGDTHALWRENCELRAVAKKACEAFEEWVAADGWDNNQFDSCCDAVARLQEVLGR